MRARRDPPRSFEVVAPVTRLVQAVVIDALELRRPVLGQQIVPLFLPAIATVILSAIFKAPDSTALAIALHQKAWRRRIGGSGGLCRCHSDSSGGYVWAG